MTEIVTLVDEQDRVTGSKYRSMLTENDRWRIITIWIFNNNNELLIAKRSMNKRTDPGKWGPSVAGTLNHGDTYLLTAHRELVEEIGIDTPLKELKLLMHPSDVGYRANMNFTGIVDLPIDSFKIQAVEVDGIAWISMYTLLEELKTQPEKYVKAMDIVKELFPDESR